jgi:hypothetical protein
MIVWGGGPGGGRYRPDVNTWSPVSSVGAPPGGGQAVWTGREMIIWGQGRYEPATDTWKPVSTAGAPSGDASVWTGEAMIVWGSQGAGNVGSGSRYDPSTDTWTPTTLTGAPNYRTNHTAVWTGQEMIVWGGFNATGLHFACPQCWLQSGGRYDPKQDAWSSTSETGVVERRQAHTAVWTGDAMVVWGGDDDIVLASPGGSYRPSTNTWTNVSTQGEPARRAEHTAVWTGTEMIVVGGIGFQASFGIGGTYCACPAGKLVYRDADGDGFGATVATPSCDGSLPAGYVANHRDCDDRSADIQPLAPEMCNLIDDDCDGQIDDDAQGLDTDGDGVRNACDNCKATANADQADGDADRAGDVCDNCAGQFNPGQGDANHDGQGDVCDPDDGPILVYADDRDHVRWNPEAGQTTWNVYEGDLFVLRSSGTYTQAPGSNPLADRHCGLTTPTVDDVEALSPGNVKFTLVSAVSGGIEGSLGTNSAAVTRPNTNPCP